jgi:hypothetical protein
MGKPDAPTPPNPQATAAAQTGTNVSTAVANAYLNNTNQVTPDGSLTYNATGSHSWTDPSTGQTYQIPTFTSTQTLSGTGQQLKNTTDQTKQGLADMALAQTGRVGTLLGTPFNPSGTAPAAGSAAGIMGVPGAATSYDPGGQIQNTFADAGKIQGADDFSADRQRVEDSLMARMNPQLARERANVEQRLADQGIRYGSQAYASAMDDYNRQATDTRFGAISQAGQEQQRMVGMSQAAQQQMYDQAMGRGSFANSAQAQQNAQNAGLAGFGNAGLAQQMAQQQAGFNASNSARNQYMQEQYQQRNQPLNEISALMSGSQVQQPNWLNSPTSQIPTTDFAGIMNQNFAQQQQNYQTAQSGWNATMGGIMGLGAGLIKSDERAKQSIVPMGSVFAAAEDGERKKLPIYEWEYKPGEGAPGRHVGPMAQGVEKIDKKAVKTIDGTKHIDPRRVMGSILRAA